MKDYSQEGYDPFLRRNDSLAVRSPNVNYLDTGINPSIPSRLYTAQLSQIRPSALYGQLLVDKNTNGSNPIQAALNKVSITGGGKVVLGIGTFTQTQTLTIPDNVSLVGLDPDRTVIDFASGTANIVTATAADNITIREITFQNCANGSAVIYLDTTRQTIIENCSFGTNISSGTTFCIRADNGLFTYLNNIDVAGCDAFLTGTLTEWLYATNVICRTTEVGIEGIAGPEGIGFSSFVCCDFHAPKYAVKGNIKATTFTGCHLLNNGTAGTAVSLDNAASDDNTFEGNVIQSTITNGIPLLLDNADLNKFTGNTIVGTNADAVILRNTADDNTFVGNRVTGHGTNALGTSYAFRIGTAANNVQDTLIAANNVQALGTVAGTVLNNGTNTVLSGNLT